jgi:hypothetical protein
MARMFKPRELKSTYINRIHQIENFPAKVKKLNRFNKFIKRKYISLTDIPEGFNGLFSNTKKN